MIVFVITCVGLSQIISIISTQRKNFLYFLFAFMGEKVFGKGGLLLKEKKDTIEELRWMGTLSGEATLLFLFLPPI